MSNFIVGTVILSYSMCGVMVVFLCRKELTNRLASVDILLLLGVFLTWPFVTFLSIVIAFSENIHWLLFWRKIKWVMLKDIKLKRDVVVQKPGDPFEGLIEVLNCQSIPDEEVVEVEDRISMIGFNSDRKRELC
jgi:hypothetical protein